MSMPRLLISPLFLLASCAASTVEIRGSVFSLDMCLTHVRVFNETGTQIALAPLRLTDESREAQEREGFLCTGEYEFTVEVPESASYEAVVTGGGAGEIRAGAISYEELEGEDFKWQLVAVPQAESSPSGEA